MSDANNGPNLVMHSARAAVADGMMHIKEQIKALEQAVVQNPRLAFDLAKVLVESTCKTILKERGRDLNNTDDMSNFFRTACSCVSFLPVALVDDRDAERSLKKTLNGLNTALLGVCELRNAFGFASHGSGGPSPEMEEIQAMLVAQAADAIIGFLYSVHRQSFSRPREVQLEFDDNPGFNEWLDEQCEPVRIFSLPPYRPSDVLFCVDQEAYRDILSDYKSEDGTSTEQLDDFGQEGGAAL